MGYSGQTSRTNRTGNPTWRILLALACVLMVVVAGAVQVAHTHADRAASHPDCSLCVSAHIAVHVAQTPVYLPGVAVATAVEMERPAVRPSTLSIFALFTRPPPAAVLPA